MALLLSQAHQILITSRRTKVVKKTILDCLEKNGQYESWLDIGAGDGKMTEAIYKSNKKIFSKVQTLDIFPVLSPKFPHTVYDGHKLPFSGSSFDLVTFIDVLHHTQDIESLLTQARRVAKKYILIKDHKYKKKWQYISLKIQDWVGNVGTECPLPYNFLKYLEWERIFNHLGLEIVCLKESIDFMYPFPLSELFSNELHFVCLLEKKNKW